MSDSNEMIDKLMKMQKNKPKEVPQRKWAYTTKEGGAWRYFEYPSSNSGIIRMENEVTNIMNWGRYQGRHPEGGDRNFTTIRTIPPFSFMRIHSLKFPDGRVWDSTLRTFTTYEQKN